MITTSSEHQLSLVTPAIFPNYAAMINSELSLDNCQILIDSPYWRMDDHVSSKSRCEQEYYTTANRLNRLVTGFGGKSSSKMSESREIQTVGQDSEMQLLDL